MRGGKSSERNANICGKSLGWWFSEKAHVLSQDSGHVFLLKYISLDDLCKDHFMLYVKPQLYWCLKENSGRKHFK